MLSVKGIITFLRSLNKLSKTKKFLAILDKYNIKVKKFTWCEIHFENPDGSRYVIQEKNAKRIKK